MKYQTSLSCYGTTLSILFLTLLSLVGQPGFAGVILQDDFEDGDVNTSIYTPLGSAELEEVGGKLVVRVFSTPEDGVRINIPEGSLSQGSAKCLRIRQDIDPSRFPVGQTWKHTIEMVNGLGDVTGFELTASRSFWNRCEYTLKNKRTQETFTTRVLKPTKSPPVIHPCPRDIHIRFDWLPGDMIQVEITDATVLAQQKELGAIYKKASSIKHDSGTSQTAYRITAWEIVAQGPSAGFD